MVYILLAGLPALSPVLLGFFLALLFFSLFFLFVFFLLFVIVALLVR